MTWRGREVKHTGDGIMASFEDLANALQCSLAIQDDFGARMAGGATRELRVRIGIAAGEPVDHNDDLFGWTVNLASRICDAADPGHILTSDLVHEMGTDRGFSFEQGSDLRAEGVRPGPGLRTELADRAISIRRRRKARSASLAAKSAARA